MKTVLSKYLSRRPENCRHHGDVVYAEEADSVWDELCRLVKDPTIPKFIKKSVGVCLLNMQEGSIGSRICNCEETALSCACYTGKYTKQQIVSAFEDKLFKDAKFKATFYKDIAMLEWVLEISDDFYTPWYKKVWNWFIQNRDTDITRLDVIERKVVDNA